MIITEVIGKLFMLKLLNKFNESVEDLMTIYKGYVRTLDKYAVPVWNAGLTDYQINDLEIIQKGATRNKDKCVQEPRPKGFVFTRRRRTRRRRTTTTTTTRSSLRASVRNATWLKI